MTKDMVLSDVNNSLKTEEDSKSQRVNVEESFVEHLMSLNEDYRQQLEATMKELRLEREKNAKTEKDLKHCRVEYNNYKLSWTMNQAEIKDLKAHVQTLHTYQRQMRRTQDTFTRLERENHKFKALNLYANAHMHANEVTRTALPLRVPPSPVEGHKRRRPYTGKTRDVQTTALPPITDNNKVVFSSRQIASPEKNSPTYLLSLGSSFCPPPPPPPPPPSGPRAYAPSRRRSKIPLVIPPIRGTSSVGSVSLDHQAKQESGQMSRASVYSRRRHE